MLHCQTEIEPLNTPRLFLLAAFCTASPLALAQQAPAVAPSQVTDAGVVADFEAYTDARNAALPGGGDVLRLAMPVREDELATAEVLRGFRARIAASDFGPTESQHLNLKILDHLLEEQISSIEFDESAMPFNSDGGFDSSLLYLADGAALRSEADVAAWLSILRAVPDHYRINIVNARRGLAAGFTQPRSTTQAVLRRAEAATESAVDADPMLAPLLRIRPGDIAPDVTENAMREARGLIAGDIAAARRGFANFLRTDYLPHARKALAITSVPGGDRFYRWAVRRHTTTALTPARIHEIGLAEIEAIRTQMAQEITAAGFDGTFPEFLTFLRTDPQFFATSRTELLEKGSEIAKRADGALPAHFATLPRLTYGVRPVPADIEEHYTTGRYFRGNPERGVAGGLMLNTHDLSQRPLYELPSLVLHEGVPGHHLQIALAQEIADAPRFRRNVYYSGFGEGWGLYAEWLGTRMGIYRTPYERFGRLSYDMWRACRLVADTGLHAMGWTIEQAKACFQENSALSPLNIEVEVARYISWPGQALAYKIGELEIRRLRTLAEQRLGTAFNERDFHDAVLLQGSMPLSLLAERIENWIAERE